MPLVKASRKYPLPGRMYLKTRVSKEAMKGRSIHHLYFQCHPFKARFHLIYQIGS